MPSLVESLSNLVAGIFHTVTAALGSILAVFQSIFNAILGVIGMAFDAIRSTLAGLAHTFEGLFKFLFSKFAFHEFKTQNADSYLQAISW
jgi:phage-related protein